MIFPAQPKPCELSTELVSALQQRYPLADVTRELLAMTLWLAKHPARTPKRPVQFIENWLKKVSPKAPTAIIGKWWASEEGTTEMGKRLGLKASPRESWSEYRARIAQAIEKRRTGT